MTTKEKVIIGAVGLVITGVMAYTIYDYNDAIKTNNELIDYINEHLKVEPNSNINKLMQKRKPNLIGTSVENDIKVKVYDNGMRVIEMKNARGRHNG